MDLENDINGTGISGGTLRRVSYQGVSQGALKDASQVMCRNCDRES